MRTGKNRVGMTPNASLRQLACQAEPGMFRGEFLVYVNGMDPRKPDERIRVQLLVDQREVALSGEPQRHRPVSGWLRVTLASAWNGVGEIILPQPAQPVGESMLVDVSDLREDVGK